MYYFDSFGVETTPLFLDEYVDLGSNKRIQQSDESYCGAYCLYMIYLIDRGFRIKSALNILVNQCKYPGIYNECFCSGCNVNQGTDSVRGMPTCFADDKYNDNDNDNNNDNVNDNFIDNDNDNDLPSSFANDVNDNDSDKGNDSDKDILIYQGTCSADLFGEKHQRGKPNNNSPTNNISVNINEDLQSWLNDDNIITEAAFPDNFRCIISGPSECGI